MARFFDSEENFFKIKEIQACTPVSAQMKKSTKGSKTYIKVNADLLMPGRRASFGFLLVLLVGFTHAPSISPFPFVSSSASSFSLPHTLSRTHTLSYTPSLFQLPHLQLWFLSCHLSPA
eukprot:m.113187 g.113187  ORF g.113187 m.113187 type:complete len:119 (-) comp22866_c0_seq2:496-852(-)